MLHQKKQKFMSIKSCTKGQLISKQNCRDLLIFTYLQKTIKIMKLFCNQQTYSKVFAFEKQVIKMFLKP